MDISSIVLGGAYRGIIAIGDIHNQYHHLRNAVKFAESNQLFIVLLGDLFDGGTAPYDVAELVCSLLDEQRAVFVIGNHDDKIYRYSLGNAVKLNPDQLDTFSKVGEDNMASFLSMVQRIVTHRASDYLHRFLDNVVFVHAATHPSLWAEDYAIHSAAKAMCLYGEVNGTRDALGFPVRTYNWIQAVPSGKTVVVGHDRTAMGKPPTVPSMLCNNYGGRVVFADSSCGKPQDGPLTGVVFTHTETEVIFNSFKLFTGCKNAAISQPIE